jgi:hypothetical protein
MFSAATGTAGHARSLLVEHDRAQRAVEERERHETGHAENRDDDTSWRVTVRIDPKRY